MSNSNLFIAAALACCSTSAVLADSNSAHLIQSGESNSAAVTQGPGSHNFAGNDALAVRQSGNRNELTFLQSGSNNAIGAAGTGFLQASGRNSATITQTSHGNSIVSVTQTGIDSVTGGDALRRNILTVLQQSGDGNSIATIWQTRSEFSSSRAANEASLTQSGASNHIETLLQSGFAQAARLTQTGAGNVIDRAEQRGPRNTITLSLNGDGNGTLDFAAANDIAGAWAGLAQGHVYQNNLLLGELAGNLLDLAITGNLNSFGFSQIGGDNVIAGTVDGDGNQTGVSQIGLSNDASFDVAGDGNLLFIDQGLWAFNHGNVADVLIDSAGRHGNQVGIRQGGLSNDARIDILGGGNLVNLTQESLLWGNATTLSITGDNNLLNARQNGGRNALDITILGNGNNSGGFTAEKPAFITASLFSSPLVPGDVIQDGSRNSISYQLGSEWQSADNNSFAFAQIGDNNTIIGSTRGSNNEVAILQRGDGNHAYFHQVGVGNIIGVSQ
jgi:hypothetical protein